MNRRKTVEVLGVTLTAEPRFSERDHTYYSTGLERCSTPDGGAAWISAHHHRSPMGSSWALTVTSVPHGVTVRSSAVTFAAAEEKLRELVRCNSYVFTAVQAARRAA